MRRQSRSRLLQVYAVREKGEIRKHGRIEVEVLAQNDIVEGIKKGTIFH